jgi:hypothetical protein
MSNVGDGASIAESNDVMAAPAGPGPLCRKVQNSHKTQPKNNQSLQRADSVQAEIEALQRRFRQIESHRKQAGLVTTGHLANVKMLQLSRLKGGNSQARDELRLETGKAHSLIRHSMGQRIGSLQDEAGIFHGKIAKENYRLVELDKKIEKQNGILAVQKRLSTKARRSKNSVYHMERRLLIDESKLDSVRGETICTVSFLNFSRPWLNSAKPYHKTKQ